MNRLYWVGATNHEVYFTSPRLDARRIKSKYLIYASSPKKALDICKKLVIQGDYTNEFKKV